MKNILSKISIQIIRKTLSPKPLIYSSRRSRSGCAAALATGLALFIAGCLPVSLQPLYREADLRFDPALIGVWGSSKDKNDTKDSWTFRKGDKQSYELLIKEGTKASPFVAHLFVIGEQRFLDLYPHEDGLKDIPVADFYKVALIPGHLFLRVDQIEPGLKMSVMKDDWLKAYLKDHQKEIEHQWILDNDSVVLTAGTEALQAFIKVHSSNKEAWEATDELSRMAESNASTSHKE